MTRQGGSSAVFITCAVTGSGDTVGKSDRVPFTPEAIADDCIAAARAGAAVAHVHVRDPITGVPSRDPDLYREVVDRVRSSDTDVVLNLTSGMGGDLVLGSVERPVPLDDAGTDMAGATERLAHVAELRPEITTLDCGTMNFGEGDYVMTNTTATLKEMARQITALGVRPEIEAFDTGHLWMAKALADDGLIEDPVMVQLCMGIPWGAPADVNTFMAMVNNIPESWTFSAFSIGRLQLQYVALAAIAGGNVRVGLEDNLYLGRGELATNAQLVERAVSILDGMNIGVKSAAEVRDELSLVRHG
ncbi:MAG: 3-keto-5-aminohexanoate cleavage protein [Actinomycetota bacterium]